MWQQLLAIQYKNIVFWKRNWISLVSMFVIITIALLGIFGSNLGSTKAELATTKVSMEKLLDPQVLFVAGSSRASPDMKRLIALFRQNVERDHGKFIELDNVDLSDGKDKGLVPFSQVYSYCFTIAELLNIARTDKFRYNENLVAAFKVSISESDRVNIEAFYTRNIIHSVSIALNLATNVEIQYSTQDSFTIDVINAPVSR
jgi:hypothetical protein